MIDILSCIGILISSVIFYKILDRILRLPRVGRCDDRYVLITGCGQGIGYEAVKRLNRLGCHVFAGCRRDESVLELKNSFSDRVYPFLIDVSNRESVRNAFNYVSSKLPQGKGLWGLVNNAATAHFLPAHMFGIDLYETTIATNLVGTIDVTITFLPLIKTAKGRVVNISSFTGRFAVPNALPYSVSKFGLEAYSDGLRRYLGSSGVKVVVIEPGHVNTNMADKEKALKNFDEINRKIVQKDEEANAEKGRDQLGKMMDQASLIVSSVDDVAQAYEHALFSRFPRARYVIGYDAKAMIYLQLLPEWFSDWFINVASPKI